MNTVSLLRMTFIGLILTSSFVQAESHREAAAICESMSFQSSKNACYAYISSVKSEYFDRGAIQVCESMGFDVGKNECVKNITSKSYERYEITNCMSLSFDSDKNRCLRVGGEVVSRNPNPGYPPPPQYPHAPQSRDYIHGTTEVWENSGVFLAPKAITQPVEMNFNTARGVVEVRLSVKDAPVRITKAYAITVSGQHLELTDLQGDLGTGGQRLIRLDSRYAIRLQKMVLEITSPKLIGPRGQLEVVVGMTR